MRVSDSVQRYTWTAIVLHWAIAAIVIAVFAWGWWMQEIPKQPPGPRADAFNLHKSVGLAVLLLMLVRVGWRLLHPPPPLSIIGFTQTGCAPSHVCQVTTAQ